MILEKAYQYLQYVPYVSYVPAAANLCTKLFVNCHKEPAEVAKEIGSIIMQTNAQI